MNNISDYDRHPMDPIIRLLGRTLFVLPLTLLSFSAGVYLSVHYCEWLWLSRFGSIITVTGLILMSSPVFDDGVYISQSKCFRFADKDEAGRSKVTSDEDKRKGGKVIAGICISIFGTVVWGFGDLAGQLV